MLKNFHLPLQMHSLSHWSCACPSQAGLLALVGHEYTFPCSLASQVACSSGKSWQQIGGRLKILSHQLPPSRVAMGSCVC